MKRVLVALCLIVGVTASTSHAWWDTVAVTVRSSPLIQEIEAEKIPGLTPDRIVDDPQCNGGSGGKAVVLTPGGPGISLDVDVKPGIYALFAIARRTDVPHNMGIVTLQVREHASNQTRSWTMPFIAKDTYFSAIMVYFPADLGGKYTLTLQLEQDIAKLNADRWGWRGTPDKFALAMLDRLKETKPGPVQVDRLELRDVLGSLEPIQQTKSRRMLTSDEQLAKIRHDFAAAPNATLNSHALMLKFKLSHAPAWFTAGRTPKERADRNNELWNTLPDYNIPVSHGTNPWTKLLGHDDDSLMFDSAAAYEQTGNAQCGWDGALLLVGVAQKYPAVDYLAQGTPATANLVNAENAFTINVPSGKEVGRGWAGRTAVDLITTYDRLFDFIHDNKDFAAEIARRVPGIHTPDDVIRYLDTRILRHIVDAADRNMIEGNDAPKALAPLVLGPGPDSDRMLRNGIFTKISMNLTHRGGIDDHAVCSFSRDGVHYIGAVSYLKDDLMDIGQILHQYRLAGGNPVFDLIQNNPHMLETARTLDQLRMAGGFRIIQGDGGDLRNTREAKPTPAFDSRILGGYGMSILESGQSQPDILLKNALAIYFGIGRGHSHQDTLNLEIVAQGTRVAPDLGGRKEQKFRGWPNMRDNRVHNLVEVDDTNFCNAGGGSVTSGTGWNTGFFCAPGVQFLEHQARATSHPQVTRYARQTVMIDVPGPGETDATSASPGNSYIFDVFRVAGGQTHTYCFHGVPTLDFSVNSPLSPTLDKDAETYLAEHFKGSQRVGVVPEMLQADWPMEADLQHSYQGAQYTPNHRVTTRLSLFGAQGRSLLIGNAYSDTYKYNFPFLYVRSHQDQGGLQSVYPALIEPFVGEPFITQKRALSVKPALSDLPSGADSAVALEVKTTGGTTDTLYASGHPEATVELEGGTRLDGKFALISTDASGLRAAQLVGGTLLRSGPIAITVPAREYRAPITAAQYPARAFTVQGKLPAKLLAGQWCGMVNPSGLRHSFKLEKLQQQGDQTLLTHEKYARYYQSAIMSRDDADQTLECEIEPPVYNADPKFIDGTTVANEAGDKSAHVTIQESDRWMHIGWPGYRTSFPNTIAWTDIPDTNGDGKHTLKMSGQRNGVEAQPISLSVTRIEKSSDTFYFEMPQEEQYQRGGWPYNDLRLTNESGAKTWRAIYPGSSYRWRLDPKSSMKVADFTDADGDGKAKLIAYLYGPGDEMVLDTAVNVRRASPGLYRVQSNTPCTLTLAAGSAASFTLGPDADHLSLHPSTLNAGQITIQLSEADLGNGVVWIKLQP